MTNDFTVTSFSLANTHTDVRGGEWHLYGRPACTTRPRMLSRKTVESIQSYAIYIIVVFPMPCRATAGVTYCDQEVSTITPLILMPSRSSAPISRYV